MTRLKYGSNPHEEKKQKNGKRRWNMSQLSNSINISPSFAIVSLFLDAEKISYMGWNPHDDKKQKMANESEIWLS